MSDNCLPSLKYKLLSVVSPLLMKGDRQIRKIIVLMIDDGILHTALKISQT